MTLQFANSDHLQGEGLQGDKAGDGGGGVLVQVAEWVPGEIQSLQPPQLQEQPGWQTEFTYFLLCLVLMWLVGGFWISWPR